MYNNIIKEFNYFALGWNGFDIECFSDENERDGWCEKYESDALSPEEVEEMIGLYHYIEDVCFDRDGIALIII